MWAEVDGERKKVAWYVLSFFLSLIDDCLPHSTITVTYTDVVAGIFYIANLHTRHLGSSMEHVSIRLAQLTLSCTNTYMMLVALAYEDIVPPNVTTETGCLSKFESLEDH
jgi:hypothetical protein